MVKQSVAMMVVTNKGVVTQIGKSSICIICIPKLKFRGGEVNWYKEDLKPAEPSRKLEQ